MGRLNRILQSEYPYHVTMRTNNKVNFEVDLDLLWEYICDQLLFCSHAFKIEIHNFVLMSNHYHMMIRTPDANLDKFMRHFNRELSREITYKTGCINHKFGGRYHASVIDDLNYYSTAYKYVYRNPMQAGVCSSVQNYKYSSLEFILCKQAYRFPVFDSYFDSINSYEQNLSWLNTSFSEIEYFNIKSALKSPYFTLSN